MVSNASNHDMRYQPLKIIIAGGFGVGKTTFVGTISEITPLRTEEEMTVASIGVDDLRGDKHATTVAFDFGRLSLDDGITLYLFGAPGQKRFVRFWPTLTMNALGAVVLLTTRTRDLAAGYPSIDFFEQRKIPYVVLVNHFDGSDHYHPDDIRDTAALSDDVPLLRGDARDRDSCRDTLIALVRHILGSPSPPG